MNSNRSRRGGSPRSVRLPLALLVLALAVPSALVAQVHEPFVEIVLSYDQPSFDTQVRLDSAELGQGTDLDLERDLGVEDSAKEIRAEVGLQISPRNRLVLDHVAFDRSGDATVSRSVQFGDVVYAADADLASRVQSRHTSASWRFAFVRTPTSEIAASIGASWLEVEAEITGTATATAGGVPAGSETLAEKGDASGPVPLVGLHGRWWLGSRLRLVGDVRYFDVEDFQGWSGSILDYGARIEYFLTRSLALGAGYGGTRIEADFEDGSRAGRVDYRFDGFRGSLVLTF